MCTKTCAKDLLESSIHAVEASVQPIMANGSSQSRVMHLQLQRVDVAHFCPFELGLGVGVTDTGMVSSQCSKPQCWKRWPSRDGGPAARAVVMISVTWW